MQESIAKPNNRNQMLVKHSNSFLVTSAQFKHPGRVAVIQIFNGYLNKRLD
jgi:hypothetical protein